jgi:type IV pilus biogenesis protein CpaD/CtpE
MTMHVWNRTLRLSILVLAIAALGFGPSACAPVEGVPESAGVHPCPNWANDPVDPYANQGSPYLGCSNDVNLLRMVERPQDLQQGRTLGPASGERQAGAVKAYDTDKVKPFSDNTANKTATSNGATTGGGQ